MSARSALRWIGSAVGAIALGFVVWRVVDQFDQIPELKWNALSVSSMAAAVLLSAVPTITAAVGMPLLMTAVGVSLPWRDSFALVGQSQIGKYLPGNVFHYLGRITLGLRRGLPAGPLSLTVGVETALTIIVALTIGAAGSLFEGTFSAPRSQSLRVALAWALVCLATVGVLGLNVRPIRSAASDFLRCRQAYYAAPNTFAVVALYVGAFVSLGVAIELIIRGVMGLETPWHWLQYTWRFAVIWVLGLITIGAPAGLGVREALLLMWFSPALGDSVALGLAGLLRLATIAADLIVFAFAWGLDTSLRRTD